MSCDVVRSRAISCAQLNERNERRAEREAALTKEAREQLAQASAQVEAEAATEAEEGEEEVAQENGRTAPAAEAGSDGGAEAEEGEASAATAAKSAKPLLYAACVAPSKVEDGSDAEAKAEAIRARDAATDGLIAAIESRDIEALTDAISAAASGGHEGVAPSDGRKWQTEELQAARTIAAAERRAQRRYEAVQSVEIDTLR